MPRTAALLTLVLGACANAGLPPETHLLGVNNGSGLRASGEAAFSQLGSTVAPVGDLNGDGVADFAFAAPLAAVDGVERAGLIAVVFGAPGLTLPEGFFPADLDGGDGFVIKGERRPLRAGHSVAAAGDVNGDGFDDLLIGAPELAINAESPGFAYLLFGGPALGAGGVVELADVNGKNGVRFVGGELGGNVGISVAGIGDVTADGFGDIVIGAPTVVALANGQLRPNAGSAYVVFGGAGLDRLIAPNGDAGLTLLDGVSGFRISAVEVGAQLGFAVARAGDVNDDGVADFLVSMPDSNIFGQTLLFFGRPGLGAGGVISLATPPADALRVRGRVVFGLFGYSVAGIGDANGDGFDDFVVGAPLDTPAGEGSGAAYVVFGGPELAPRQLVDVATAPPGRVLRIRGVLGDSISDAGDLAGFSVAGGDLDGDGVSEVIVGMPSSNVGELINAGRAVVFFGGPRLATLGEIDADTMLAGWTARALGGGINAQWGRSVAFLGDVNADGAGDFAVGGPGYDPDSVRDAGGAAAVFGGLRDPGDLDCDGRVGAIDLAILLAAWGTSEPSADVNGDGMVNQADLAQLLSLWG